jgi:hypothetical protein
MEIVRVIALLNSVAYQHKTEEAPVIAEPEFASFNPSRLKDYSQQSEQESNSFRGYRPNVSDALPA